MGLLEGPAQAFVGELRIAQEVDAADLDLLLAVDQEGDVDGLTGAQRIVVDAYVDLRIAEALFGPVVADELFVLVDDVVGELAAALEFEFFEQILLFALGDAFEGPVVDARTLLEEDLQIEAVALDFGADLHVGEEALAPEARDGVGDEVAGQVDRVAFDQAGRRFENVRVEVFHAVDVDLADVVEFGVSAAFEHRRIFGEGGFGELCGIRRIRLECGLRLGGYIRAAKRREEGCCREYLT